MLVNLVVGLGMLVIVPLGLRLMGLPGWLRRLWLFAAGGGAASMWLPRGWGAAGVAAAYLIATLILALWVFRVEGIALRTAVVAPSIAGLALVAERAGYPLFGFDLEILRLTVAHFHYAGFAAALVAGLLCRTEPSPAARLAALSVPAGTGIVLLGFFTADLVELLGALVLTTGMWLVGWLLWQRRAVLFRVAAVVLVATMALAVEYAAGEALGWPHLGLGWMAATHGVGNAVGFALCAVLGFRFREGL